MTTPTLPPQRWAGLYSPAAMRALVDGVVLALDAEPRAAPVADPATSHSSTLPYLAWYLPALAYDIDGSVAQRRLAVAGATQLLDRLGTEGALDLLGAANGVTITLIYEAETTEGTPYERKKNVSVRVTTPRRVVDDLWIQYLTRAVGACLPKTLELVDLVVDDDD